MASRRTKIVSSALALSVGISAYFAYTVFAIQGQGVLAQSPLNVQSQIPPAFIMAVDDSGSMTFENLFPGQDGQACWSIANKSFFESDGSLRVVPDNGANNDDGNGTNQCGYNQLIPYAGYRIDANRRAVPPVDTFGFARSSEYNPAYYDPTETYSPWLNSDGSGYGALPGNPDGNASTLATRVDPRNATPVINMTLDRREIGTNGVFRVHSNMVLPEGTEYYVTGSCGGLGTNAGTRNRWVTLNSAQTVTASCDVGLAYYPAKFYLRTATPAPAGFITAVVTPGATGGRSLAPDACGVGCNMYRYEIKAANYTSAAAYDTAIQNFANWFSFYGNRNRSMVAGMTRSLVDVRNMRVGFFTINSTPTVAMRSMNTPSEKSALYTSLLSLPASGGTPNLRAVNHIGTQFQRTDAAAPIQLTCQKNAGMLFTDGYSNQGSPGASAVTGLGAPFDPTPANSMAAIATKYYQATLRTGPTFPAGKVPVPAACAAPNPDPRLDCRADLHMNFYGVTLGARGRIYNSDVPRDAYVAPFPAWVGHTDDDPSTVDDIWHATINTRGELINASTPNAITAAMRRVLASVTAGSSPAGSIALTGARVGEGSLTVSPFYEARNEGTDWYSRLTAQTVSSNPLTGEVSFATAWEASAKLPLAAARNQVWYGSSGGIARQFTAGNVGNLSALCDNPTPGQSLCTAASLAALGGTGANATTLDQAISYLKGDQSREVDRSPTGTLRFRTTGLGDIVNSTPVVSAPTDDYGYRSLAGTLGTSYRTYVTTGKSARRPMVYAGANDGMLHGFDGRTTSEGGVESFAYIPRSVLGFTGNLLYPYDPSNSNDQRFQHRYFVDGPLSVSDAYYSGGWQTVLVGSTGAGARGAFALNVSGVSAAGGNFSATDRLWEINEFDTSLASNVRSNIGYVLGRSVVVPVKTGDANGPVKWRAIFGNGYNSASGKAVLYLVDIGTGSPTITMIEANESGGSVPPGSNGLGNIVVTDRWGPAADNSLTASSRDGFADTVYAADQKGAIWKFDLRSATPANQTKPLFTTLQYTTGPQAGYRQPIIGGLTASAGPGGGVLIYFGTGSFSFEGDPADTTQQSLYAVQDNVSGAPTTTLTRGALLQQTIVGTVDGVRSTSSNAITPGRTGWYLDLPLGERFVGYPRVESGILFMPTYAPNNVTACETVGVNWLYGLNALSGAAGLSSVKVGSPTGDSPGSGTGAVALDTKGTAPVKDVAVLTSPRTTPLASGATPDDLNKALASQCSMVIQVAGAPSLYLPRACGRQSWRQIQ